MRARACGAVLPAAASKESRVLTRRSARGRRPCSLSPRRGGARRSMQVPPHRHAKPRSPSFFRHASHRLFVAVVSSAPPPSRADSAPLWSRATRGRARRRCGPPSALWRRRSAVRLCSTWSRGRWSPRCRRTRISWRTAWPRRRPKQKQKRLRHCSKIARARALSSCVHGALNHAQGARDSPWAPHAARASERHFFSDE